MVDLPRGANAGGHVLCRERLAAAAVARPGLLDLTIFFSGPEPGIEDLAPHVQLRTLPAVFSTRRLAWLTGTLPDHTDLAPWHPLLAKRLSHGFDVLHTTDGLFAYARTAARVAARRGLPLVNSIHTATPDLTRLFTARTLQRLLGAGWLGRLACDGLNLPEGAAAAKRHALRRHQAGCAHALVSRPDDRRQALTSPHRTISASGSPKSPDDTRRPSPESAAARGATWGEGFSPSSPRPGSRRPAGRQEQRHRSAGSAPAGAGGYRWPAAAAGGGAPPGAPPGPAYRCAAQPRFSMGTYCRTGSPT